MRDKLRKILTSGLPPFLIKMGRKLKTGQDITFKGPYFSWSGAVAEAGGYNSQDILDRVRAAAIQVRDGNAVYERDSVLFEKIEYSWPVLSALLWSAVGGDTLRVLDFGGSLGTSYYQNQRFLTSFRDLRWAVVEQPHFVECGIKEFQNDRLFFFKTIDEAVQGISPGVALVSSVLQYVEHFPDVISAVIAHRIPVVILDRVSVTFDDKDQVFLQRVPSKIYKASYPCFMISQSKLIRTFLEADYELVSDFESLPFPQLESIRARNRGFIFRLKR